VEKQIRNNLIKFSKTLTFFLVTSLIWWGFFRVESVKAVCTGTPAACGSLGEGGCATCGCTWTSGSCSNNGSCGGCGDSSACSGCLAAGCVWDAANCYNNGSCSNCSDSTSCDACSCASCNWGGVSCPWVAAWNGTEWVKEHEAFPFAIFKSVESTSYDSLPNLKCIDGEAKIKIYEGLPEITYLNSFIAYGVKKTDGFMKPDLNGLPRVINKWMGPDRCSDSTGNYNRGCMELIKDQDEIFFEPRFDPAKIDDWLILEFDKITSENIKLYLVARKQPFLTTYYEYMVHIMGQRQFSIFNEISSWPVIKEITTDWWKNNLEMQIEVWNGKSWERQGLIAAGYHMPGSGADDFLVSLNKLDKESDILKIRLKFMTGSFGIDYVALDDSPDPELEIRELSPKEIRFNGERVDSIAGEMRYNDSIVITYDCYNNEDIYFLIKGYYNTTEFVRERQKDPISAWSEFFMFFMGGKRYVVKTAAEKGLFKEAGSMSVFTDKEIRAQKKSCPVVYAVIAEILLVLIIGCLLLFKVNHKIIFWLFIIGTLIVGLFIFNTTFVQGTASCQGTLNCSNCTQTDCENCSQCAWDPAGPCEGTLSCSGLGESDCTSCSQCSWTAASCSGTPTDCSAHTNESDCTTCGCTWNSPPTVTSVSLNGGSSITLVENNTVSVSATATVSDADGYADIQTVRGKIYRSGVSGGENCTNDDNNCYEDTNCSLSDCSGNSCTATCSVNIQFFAEPTDNGTYAQSQGWDSEEWVAWIEATDSQNQTGNADNSASEDVDVNTLLALDFDVASIDYGTVNPNAVSIEQAVEIQTTGNVPIDVNLLGTDMTWNSETISVSQQKYSLTSGFDWETEGTALSGSPAFLELASGKPTQSPTNATDDIYWKLKVPIEKPAGGPYSGTNTFEATTD